MLCWKCASPLQTPKKISFRELCQSCGAALHCCKNCIFYEPGRANDCKVPETDTITDRSANNFCEEFSLLGQHRPQASRNDAKKRFESLFKDENT